jgi:hypothetical protein
VLLSLGGGPGGDPFGGGPWCGGPPGGGPPSGGGPGGPPCAVLNANIPTLSWRTPCEQFINVFQIFPNFSPPPAPQLTPKPLSRQMTPSFCFLAWQSALWGLYRRRRTRSVATISANDRKRGFVRTTVLITMI